jgi:D-arabinitol dehydrogenase (NADP+)
VPRRCRAEDSGSGGDGTPVKAIVYDIPRRWKYADVPDPVPGPGEVTLKVIAAGICGTDLHLHAGEFGPVYPLTPGHEIAGVVAAIGECVSGLSPGELVALDNMTACGLCAQCRRARPQFCAGMRALGLTDPGGFAEFVVAAAGKCHAAGDLGAEVAAFAEPIACVVHGLDELQLRPGSDVLVFGTGPTGLILAQLLRSAGASRVTVAGRTPFKLELAAGYGADETVLMAQGGHAHRARLAQLAPEGFDVVIDATGSIDVLAGCVSLLGIGGMLFVYGMAPEQARLQVSPYEIFRRQLTIRGSFSQAYSFDRAMALLRTGRVSTDGMVTHRFRLPEYGAAIEAVAHDSGCLKALITP